MSEKQKIIELIDLFEYFKDFETCNTLKKRTGIDISRHYKITFKNAFKKFEDITSEEDSFKNDGSIAEHLEKKIWIIVNRYKNDYYMS